MTRKIKVLLLLLLIIYGCKSPKNPKIDFLASNTEIATNETTTYQNVADSTFVNLKDYDNNFVFDMKYATKDNFLNAKVYECSECFLRLKTVNALIKANNTFRKLGFKIKIFDCYRPLDVQKKMWKVVPDANFVADPKKGSIHNRGGAVDITLVDLSGNELDMGTTFDFFGKEAAHDYLNLPQKVIQNRKLLKFIMIENNFKIFDSEWWHYNLADATDFKISNFKWDCK